MGRLSLTLCLMSLLPAIAFADDDASRVPAPSTVRNAVLDRDSPIPILLAENSAPAVMLTSPVPAP